MEKILMHIIFGSKGGENRGKIIRQLYIRPSNANQLSKNLNLNYRTVIYHLNILKKIMSSTRQKTNMGKHIFFQKR